MISEAQIYKRLAEPLLVRNFKFTLHSPVCQLNPTFRNSHTLQFFFSF